MNSGSSIILGSNQGVFNFKDSEGLSAIKTLEGIPIMTSGFKGATNEGIPLLKESIGNSEIPLPINLPPPPTLVISKNINPKPQLKPTKIKDKEEVNFLLPWSDKVFTEEDSKMYKRRNRMSMELILVYDILVAVLFLVAYLRYRQDYMFWTVFAISIVWTLFGSFSIWYGTLNGDLTVGIVLAVVFLLLLFAYGAVVLEPRHQLYNQYSSIKT